MPMLSRNTEAKLIRKAKAGDARAIEALIRAHQEALYAFLLRMAGKPHLAEDIAQEAFVRVLKNLDRFDSRFRFSTWLFTIAKRLLVNSIQKQKPAYDTDSLGIHHGHEPWPGLDTMQTESRRQVRDVIDAALMSLNEQQREIVLLFHQQGWPIVEIAQHMRMPEGTIKSHLHRARKRMRVMISADEHLLRQVEDVWA